MLGLYFGICPLPDESVSGLSEESPFFLRRFFNLNLSDLCCLYIGITQSRETLGINGKTPVEFDGINATLCVSNSHGLPALYPCCCLFSSYAFPFCLFAARYNIFD